MYNQLRDLQVEILNCRRCIEKGYKVSPNPIFSGTEAARVMLVGQAPGIMNNESPYPFNNGRAGKTLFQWLEKAGWKESEFRTKHYIASVTRCYPGRNLKGTGDRIPSRVERELCGIWLQKELGLMDISLVIPMGKLAINIFFDKSKQLVEVIGNTYEIDGRYVVAIPHPSGASTWLNNLPHKALLEKAINELRKIKESNNF